MLQIGRFSHRGTGGTLVSGPAGAALVPAHLVDAAVEVVWGRADVGAWLSGLLAADESVVFLDVNGPQTYLTALGRVTVAGLPAGAAEAMSWEAPIWAWALNPAEWQWLEVGLGPDEGGEWVCSPEDRVPAGRVRIGRGFDEVERVNTAAPAPLPAPGQIVAPDEAPPVVEPVVEAPPEPKHAASDPVVGFAPEPPAEQPVEEIADFPPPPVVDTQPKAADPGIVDPTPGPPPAPAFEAPAAHGFLWAPDPVPAPEAAAPKVLDDEVFDDEPPALVPEADLSASAAEAGAASATPSTSEVNPEAFEETMTPEALAQMSAANSAEATVMRRVSGTGETGPSGFLIYGGTAPTEVVRDVVIGREPDARALTGRPAATTLRVLSPQTEISRSHCAVMLTAPGTWSLMDLGSANGTLLRHMDGTFQEVTPMVIHPLADGDLIDVGEGTTIEFRIR